MIGWQLWATPTSSFSQLTLAESPQNDAEATPFHSCGVYNKLKPPAQRNWFFTVWSKPGIHPKTRGGGKTRRWDQVKWQQSANVHRSYPKFVPVIKMHSLSPFSFHSTHSIVRSKLRTCWCGHSLCISFSIKNKSLNLAVVKKWYGSAATFCSSWSAWTGTVRGHQQESWTWHIPDCDLTPPASTHWNSSNY